MSVIDDYLKTLEAPEREALERVRTIAKSIAPEAEDTIGYGMPVLKVHGKYLIGFSAFKDHLSIFPGSEPIEALQDKLKGYKQSKGTIQFTLDKQIPDPLLKEIILGCIQYNVPAK